MIHTIGVYSVTYIFCNDIAACSIEVSILGDCAWGTWLRVGVGVETPFVDSGWRFLTPGMLMFKIGAELMSSSSVKSDCSISNSLIIARRDE
jgi:hypothetical protein